MDTSNAFACWVPVHVFGAVDVSISQRISITTALQGVSVMRVGHGQMSA